MFPATGGPVMDNLLVKAVVAGLFFGAWPLLMNRSGLSGNISSLVFAAVVLVCVIPFSLRPIFSGNTDLAQASWTMAILSGIAAAVGMMVFNGMLAKATPQSVGTLFVLMILVQTTVPVVYDAVMNGGISLTKAAGFVFAAVAAILLVRS